MACHYVSLCRFLIFLSPPSFLFPSATGESTWDPEVFIIIIIIFPFWWLSYNKHSICHSAGGENACGRGVGSKCSCLTKKKKDLLPKWMCRPKAPTPFEPITTLEVWVCGSFYGLSTRISQVIIKLRPPPDIRGWLLKYSNHMPLLVWDGTLSVNFTVGYSFRCGEKQNENQFSKNNVRNFDFWIVT